MGATAHRSGRLRLELLAALGDRIREIEDPRELAYAAAELLGRHLEVSRAGYGTIDLEDESISIDRDWNAPGIKSLAGTLKFRDYGSYIDDLKRGEIVILEDAETDPRTHDRAEALKALSARSLINMPVSEHGKVVALLYLNNAAPRRWSDDEITLIFEVAERTRTAIERLRAERALRETTERLAFLDRLGKEIALAKDADAVMATTTKRLGEHLGVSICAYADMAADQDHFTIRGDWSAPGSPSIVGYYSLADFGKLAVSNLSANRPLIINNNLTEIDAAEAKTFQDIGITATICMPLVKQGRLAALMAIHDKEPRVWSERELALLTEVTERSWAHIERVRSEEAARTSEERLRLATDAAAIGIWDYDPVTDTLRWDDRCKALFGLPPEASVSYEHTFLPGLHPDDRSRADNAVRQALKSGGSSRYDIEYRTIGLHDGKERWIAATGDALFENGRAVRFVGTVIDITSRKRIERHLQVINATAATVAAELDVEIIVQTVTDVGVELTGAQFGAFFYNLVDENGDSYTLYTLSGAPRSAFENFPMPRNTAVFEPTFRGTGVVRSDDILQDPRYGRNSPRKGMPEGHLPVRSYLAVPVTSRSGEMLGGLFFGHSDVGVFGAEHEAAMLGLAGHAASAIDNSRLFKALQTLNSTLEQRVVEAVAERARAEEHLRQSQKMEAVGQLTGGIAHDFNNMLAVIIGGLNLVQRKLRNGDTNVNMFVEGAVEGAQRAAELTKRLLAFSRRQPLAPKVMNPNRLVSGMSELLGRTLGEPIQIETVLAAGLWQIEVDAGQLESTLLNLCVNARDAMPAGGKLTIETSNTHVDERFAKQNGIPVGQYVLLSVTDTGVGMSADVMERAFDPFFTTKSVGKGTGLGLSQVYGFVRQSGGSVRIYSEQGVGTTLKIYLPRSHKSVPELRATPPAPENTGSAAEVIMVVEDEDRVRSMATEALRDLGYSVLEMRGPREALAALEGGTVPSLLFTDVVMPEMSGRELADRVKVVQPSLKVLYTTGYTRDAIVHNGTLDFGTELLTKPYTIDELAEKIRKVIDK
ncbi:MULTISPECIES: GAF domain-containing protein [unclassified Mesorhizobium]|uniref:GAF domain-containing hybrid sensor histidine kinase/response regulator n=1 Tax=unclassified Mesorhizobium TaxID=325217 RepID=UPI00109208DF|nr:MULTISPECIES: GAF domain-containing protein [unclassified Mesorhizobium]TGP95480.1 GAF domain-containing protein [Mesorhizobium sp. M8A.F.Ca.ET.218.01.1.1]TGT19311.1 GAF domain-containing protein [Mesorhizobium sp. M8A.F.Ca.ET.213.01.1.1]